MALNYIYKKYKDVYTLENQGLVPLTYTLKKIECDTVTIVEEGTIAVSTIFTIPITAFDAVYSLTISDGVETLTLPDILQYNNFLLSIIDNIEEVVCGCKNCHDCKDCGDGDKCHECKLYLNTLTGVLAYAYLNNPRYTSYLNSIAEELKCSLSTKILCMLANNMMNGDEDTTHMFKHIIGMHYLAFYLFDLVGAADEEEASYIKLKYKSSKILTCLKKLGIDIDETTDIFLSDMQVYFWQIDDLFEDIDDIIPIFGNTYLADKQVVDFQEFEQGKIVTYTTVGRVAFAIKETDIQNFLIMDSLGNDVTDEFDNHYFNTERTILFVSKIPYSHSNMFFKFKSVIYNE